jgi:hypothetical protein
MSLAGLLRLTTSAALAAILSLSTLAQASATRCPGISSLDFNGLQTSEPRATGFMVGLWRAEASARNGGDATYLFDATGLVTVETRSCGPMEGCPPTRFRGSYAAFALNGGMVSIAVLQPERGCSVMHLQVIDANTLAIADGRLRWVLRRSAAARQG